MGSKKNKQERRAEKLRARSLQKQRSQTRSYVFSTVAVIVFVGLSIWGASKYSQREVLPPTDLSGHVETWPESHVLDKPMPIAQQKHVLEHVEVENGSMPGVVINYNCDDFECEEDLIENLKNLALEYPEFLYVAPFEDMTVKIAITRYGEIEVFDEYDEKALHDFIEN